MSDRVWSGGRQRSRSGISWSLVVSFRVWGPLGSASPYPHPLPGVLPPRLDKMGLGVLPTQQGNETHFRRPRSCPPPQVPQRRLTGGSLRAEDPVSCPCPPTVCVPLLSVTPPALLPSGTQARALGMVALVFWGRHGQRQPRAPHLLLLLESSVLGEARRVVGRGRPSSGCCRPHPCPGTWPCPRWAQLCPQPRSWSLAQLWGCCGFTAEGRGQAAGDRLSRGERLGSSLTSASCRCRVVCSSESSCLLTSPGLRQGTH